MKARLPGRLDAAGSAAHVLPNQLLPENP